MAVFELRFRNLLTLGALLIFGQLGSLYALPQISPQCERIISLAPSITETIFELGLDSKLAGVTRYCNYPEQAKVKTKVGGYLDPSYETILSLNPSLVLLFPEHDKEKFRRFSIPTLEIDHQSISGILKSFEVIGEYCGLEARGKELREKLQEKIDRIAQRVENQSTKEVLVVVGKSGEQVKGSSLFVSGRDGFYFELLQILGARSVYSGDTAGYATIGAEGLLSLNPEIIFDIVPHREKMGWSKDKILKAWQEFPELRAVKSQQVYLFEDDYFFLPGPRVDQALLGFAKHIYPGAFKEAL